MPNEQESKSGRILVFRVQQQRLSLVAQHRVNGVLNIFLIYVEYDVVNICLIWCVG